VRDEKKLHMTPRRNLVYQAVRNASGHPTAADVMQRLQEDGHRLAYATVYNALRHLTETGMIRELQVGFGPARYDGRLDSHQHVVCAECGRVDEVFGLQTADYRDIIVQETGYRVEGVNVIAQGLCPDCASK
jgi:Fur family peroxide stress response transcriptional regulator